VTDLARLIDEADNPLTPQAIADLCGVDRVTVWRWLRGETRPPAATMRLLRLAMTGDLGEVWPDLSGWSVLRGRLFSPGSDIPIDWRDVAAIHWIKQMAYRPRRSEPLQLRLAFGQAAGNDLADKAVSATDDARSVP